MVFGEHISGLIFLKRCKVVSFFGTNFTNDVNIDFDDDLQNYFCCDYHHGRF